MQTILFVCPHGAAKSVLAASMFQHLAQQRGLAWRAASAGMDPDPNFPDAVVEFLRSENLALPGHAPHLVTDDELQAAARIVALGCNFDAQALPTVPILHWDDVPPVSQEIRVAIQEIRARVEQLVTELATTSPTDSND